MSANFATSGKPTWAVTAWVDHNNVFIEIPVKDQAPWIDKFPLTAAGLGEALSKMRSYHTVQAGPSTYSAPPRPTVLASTKTNALALAILRKHGIL